MLFRVYIVISLIFGKHEVDSEVFFEDFDSRRRGRHKTLIPNDSNYIGSFGQEVWVTSLGRLKNYRLPKTEIDEGVSMIILASECH